MLGFVLRFSFSSSGTGLFIYIRPERATDSHSSLSLSLSLGIHGAFPQMTELRVIVSVAKRVIADWWQSFNIVAMARETRELKELIEDKNRATTDAWNAYCKGV